MLISLLKVNVPDPGVIPRLPKATSAIKLDKSTGSSLV